MKKSRVFTVEAVDPKSKKVTLKSGEYSMVLSSVRDEFIGIPLSEFKKHPKVGVTLEVPAAKEEMFTTAHGLNPPGK
jgi:hypothetical protein